MLHPDLADSLQLRITLIADHEFRDRDPTAHLDALKEVSMSISRWHDDHRHELPPRLEHFLANCSYDKALRFLESDGQWIGH